MTTPKKTVDHPRDTQTLDCLGELARRLGSLAALNSDKNVPHDAVTLALTNTLKRIELVSERLEPLTTTAP